jgi:hypothetical protein
MPFDVFAKGDTWNQDLRALPGGSLKCRQLAPVHQLAYVLIATPQDRSGFAPKHHRRQFREDGIQ